MNEYSETDVMALCRQGPLCPAPLRIAHSHWMTHIPFAFWLIQILRPRLLVELGTYQGVSFCAFCQQIARLGLDCQACAVDTWQGDAHMGAYARTIQADLAAHIAAHYASFAALLPMTFDLALEQFEDSSIDLLHLDGCHENDAILHDFNAWLPKISQRGIVLVHDVTARFKGFGGVTAWRQISERFPTFLFTHGFGLGVVFVGKNTPGPLAALASLQEDSISAFRKKFHEQGQIYQLLFDLAEEKGHPLQACIDSLQEQLARESSNHCQEMEKLRQALIDAEQRQRTLLNSRSWKITAPLRKLRAIFRR